MPLGQGSPSLLWDLMLDDLRWTWCNKNRNKVHNKCNVFASSWNHPLPPTLEKLSSMILIPGALKGTTALGYSHKNYYRETMWVAQLCPTLCDPIDYNPPGPSVHGILQARILEWVAILFSRGSSWPRDQTQVSCITDWLFTIWAIREAHPTTHTHTYIYACFAQWLSHVWFFVTPWTVAHLVPLFMGFFQTRILEFVAISYSRGSSRPRN